MSLLSLRDLRVSFGRGGRETTAVAGIGFDLEPGRCVALVGESGSGKSVTARSLLGLHGPGARVEAGRLDVAGQDARRYSDRQWRPVRGTEIGYILQDALVSLDPLRTIGQELGEAVTATTGLRGPAVRERALELLARARMPEPERRLDEYPAQLSGGLRQRALIASALAGDPGVLIADEPTTALDVSVQKEILELFGELKDTGLGLLLISHDLAVVARLADEILVLRGGEVVESGPAADVLGSPQHAYTRTLLDAVPRFDPAAGGRPVARPRAATGDRTGGDTEAPAHVNGAPGTACGNVGEALPGDDAAGIDRQAGSAGALAARVASGPGHGEAPRPDGATERPLLSVEGIEKRFGARPVLRGVGLQLYPGRTLGLVGESGSGKTTLSRIIAGYERPDAGSIRWRGADGSGRTDGPGGARSTGGARGTSKAGGSAAPDWQRRGVQFVYQDPLSSFDPRFTIGRTLGEALSLVHGRRPRRERKAEITSWLERVGLDGGLAGRRALTLSGGQRQRVAIARALALQPRLLILDEPVSALDVSVQRQILELLDELQAETGVAYLFVSHDLGVVQRMSDDIAVLRDGELREYGPAGQVLARPADAYTRTLIDAVPRLP
ncbi:ATP-binding cassette domain-containing protein [Sediminivirga luteola]|uniref:ATP-binding cassette domain-containing protein n=1 Tax=Sediminivirga luteola TaxID=1774748 RepID=UPI001F58CAF6|nr:ABC transporter ATP-binding protein [Sediminivirga luteola]MCI2265463.1 ABC transporter ATP-binding protein [Sediminivirga luteola]